MRISIIIPKKRTDQSIYEFQWNQYIRWLLLQKIQDKSSFKNSREYIEYIDYSTLTCAPGPPDGPAIPGGPDSPRSPGRPLSPFPPGSPFCPYIKISYCKC